MCNLCKELTKADTIIERIESGENKAHDTFMDLSILSILVNKVATDLAGSYNPCCIEARNAYNRIHAKYRYHNEEFIRERTKVKRRRKTRVLLQLRQWLYSIRS